MYVSGVDHVGLSLWVSLSRERVSGVDRLDLTGYFGWCRHYLFCDLLSQERVSAVTRFGVPSQGK